MFRANNCSLRTTITFFCQNYGKTMATSNNKMKRAVLRQYIQLCLCHTESDARMPSLDYTIFGNACRSAWACERHDMWAARHETRCLLRTNCKFISYRVALVLTAREARVSCILSHEGHLYLSRIVQTSQW